MTVSKSKALGGTLIVAGTAIGAGMLALPVVTSLGGFLPASVIFVICYLFSAATGLLLLEVCHWMPQDSNIVSMAKHLLGPFGKIAAWILYLFLFYTLTTAYVAGGGDFVTSLFGGFLPKSIGIILFTVGFGLVVYLGTQAVDRINFILMIGLVITYLFFVVLGFSKVEFYLLERVNWVHGILALPVIFTSFSYQGVIPSLNTYLDRNAQVVRKVILIGTAIPLVAYIIWEFLILGAIPLDGPHGLKQTLEQGSSAIEPLKFFFRGSPVLRIGQFFGAFALTTSFLGVTLGLLDFLSDGLQIPKIGWKKVFLCALIYVPPMIIVMINPTIFLRALGYAGGIGCALLLGLLPILMVWSGRYVKKYPSLNRQLPGGKWMLGALMAFVAFELLVEVVQEFYVH